MKEGRKEITLDQLAEMRKRGVQGILDNIEVEAKVIVRDKDGNIKQAMTLDEVIPNED